MKTTFTFRIETEDLEKLKLIAEKEKRTVSNFLDVTVQNVIAKYEKKHGAIEKTPDKNTKGKG